MVIYVYYGNDIIAWIYFRKDGIMVDINKLKPGDKLVTKSCNVKCSVLYIDQKNKYVLMINDLNFPFIVFEEALKYYSYEKEKRKWSKWEDVNVFFYNPLNGSKITLNTKMRNNGKKTQIRWGIFKTEASCNDKAGDKFDPVIGVRIASARLIIKYIERLITNVAIKES